MCFLKLLPAFYIHCPCLSDPALQLCADEYLTRPLHVHLLRLHQEGDPTPQRQSSWKESQDQ